MANVAVRLAEGQRRLGHDARVIAFPEDLFKEGVDSVLAGSGPLGWNFAMRRLPIAWSSFHVIHIHGGVWRSQVYYYVLRCKTRSAAWVVHLHGSESRGKKGLHHLHLADTILCSTPDLRRFVSRARWLPNPILLPPAASPWRPSDRFRFGHFPTNRIIKGTDTILRAFNEVFGPPVEIVRPQEGGERRVWQSTELVIGERLSHERVLHLMEECDAVIDHVSTIGPVSLVALEAMSLGRAAISSYDVEAYPRDCPVIRVTPQTVATTLRAISRDPSTLQEAAARGRPYVEAIHDLDLIARRTLDLYREAITRRAAFWRQRSP